MTMPIEEKERHMVDWWEGNMKIFSKMNLKREDFGKVVLNSRLLFRHGIVELMKLSSKLDIPMYVVSGGISEIIEASFYSILYNGETSQSYDQEVDILNYWEKQIKVLSNRFIY